MTGSFIVKKGLICYDVVACNVMLHQQHTQNTTPVHCSCSIYSHTYRAWDASVGVCHSGHMGHLNESMDYYPWLHTFAFWLGACLPAALSAVTLVSQEIVAMQ